MFLATGLCYVKHSILARPDSFWGPHSMRWASVANLEVALALLLIAPALGSPSHSFSSRTQMCSKQECGGYAFSTGPRPRLSCLTAHELIRTSPCPPVHPSLDSAQPRCTSDPQQAASHLGWPKPFKPHVSHRQMVLNNKRNRT